MSMHATVLAVVLAAVDPLFYLFLAGALPFVALMIYLSVRPLTLDRRESGAEGASGSAEGASGSAEA